MHEPLGFNPSSIYNAEYEEAKYKVEKQQEFARVKERAKRQGVPPPHIIRERDGARYQLEDRGLVIVEKESFNQLEEDLAQADNSECVLGAEKHAEIIRESCIRVINECKGVVPDEKITRAFPGIDLQNPGDYDFKQSALKFFILSPDNYNSFDAAIDASAAKKRQENTISMGKIVNKASKYTERVESNDPNVSITRVTEVKSERDMVVVNEQTCLHLSDSTPEESKLKKVEDYLAEVVRHEVLHAFGVGDDFPYVVGESIVDLYARKLTKQDESKTPLSSKPGVVLVMGAAKVLNDNGVPFDDIDSVFMRGNKVPEKRSQTEDNLKRLLGDEFTEKFFTSGFTKEEMAHYAKYLYEINF